MIAHGFGIEQTLPIPGYLFAWAAAIVLIASFAALAVLWPRPRFTHARERTLLELGVGPAAALRFGAGALGVALFGLVVYAGLAGEQENPYRNLAPNAIYLLFWVGIPVVSALLGDVFRPLNPWRAIGRAGGSVLRTAGARPLRPGRADELCYWPAVAGVLAFAWLEVIAAADASPRTLAWLALGYAVVQLAGYAVYGVESWDARGDGFAVYFRLFACMAPLAWRHGNRLVLRRPFEGLTRLATPPGAVALLVVAIGSTSYDGLSRGELWREAAAELRGPLGEYLTGTIGLLLMIGLVSAIYAFGVRGMLRVGVRHDRRDLALRFVHSLVPIALAYVVAHYFTFALYQGQALGYLVSDPLGDGTDLLGTRDAGIDLTVLSAGVIWGVQLAALLAGHVAALALAHERALISFRRPYDATRSQYWTLTVMVGFTCLGLWLLESAG